MTGALSLKVVSAADGFVANITERSFAVDTCDQVVLAFLVINCTTLFIRTLNAKLDVYIGVFGDSEVLIEHLEGYLQRLQIFLLLQMRGVFFEVLLALSGV